MAEYEKVNGYKVKGYEKIFTDENDAITQCKSIEIDEAFERFGHIITTSNARTWLDKNKHIVINYLQRDDDTKKETKPNIRLLRDKEIIKESDLVYWFSLPDWRRVGRFIGQEYNHITHGQIGRLIS